MDAVTHGIRNMLPWGDVLKPDEIEALWAYVAGGERKTERRRSRGRMVAKAK